MATGGSPPADGRDTKATMATSDAARAGGAQAAQVKVFREGEEAQSAALLEQAEEAAAVGFHQGAAAAGRGTPEFCTTAYGSRAKIPNTCGGGGSIFRHTRNTRKGAAGEGIDGSAGLRSNTRRSTSHMPEAVGARGPTPGCLRLVRSP
jgi:hypothetical protein